MAQCPFCKGPVNEDLLRFGGNCPSCLILIPGEEAATDPGEEKRKAEDEAHRKQAEARVRRQHLLIGGAAALVVAGVAIAILTREPPPTPLALDVGEFYIVPIEAHVTAEVPADPSQAGTPAPKSSGGGQKAAAVASSGGSSSGASSTARAPESSGQSAVVASADPATTAPSSSGSSASSGAGGDPFAVAVGGPKSRSANVTLKDEGEIRQMVLDVIKTGQKQLQGCYEARLKENPALRGTWEIAWVLTKEGKAKDVEVSPRGTRDSDFEGCMSRSVASWRFQPVYEAMSIPPIPFKFGSRG